MQSQQTVKTEQDKIQLVQEAGNSVKELEISKDLEIGNIIDSCIKKLPVDQNRNNYSYLAEKWNLKEQDLRDKVINYQLWERMGGTEGFKDIPTEILSLALSKKVPNFEKMQHILYAQRNHLSFTAFLEYMADKMVNYKPAPKPKSLKHYLTILIEYVSRGSYGKIIKKTPELQDLLISFINKVIFYQLVPVEKINLPNKTKNSEELGQNKAA